MSGKPMIELRENLYSLALPVIHSGEDNHLLFNFNAQQFNYSTPKPITIDEQLTLRINEHADNELSAEVFTTLNKLFETVE